MARARTIKPGLIRSRSMRAVSGMARLTLIQLWPIAYAGRLTSHPLSLARRLHPGGELREAFGSECEKPRDDKALSPAAEIPEPFASSRIARAKILKALTCRALRPISRAIQEAKDFSMRSTCFLSS